MKKYFLLSALFLMSLLKAAAQSSGAEIRPFKGTFENREAQLSLVIDLYDTTIEAPGLSFLGKLNGYLAGRGVYGTWLLVDHKVEGEKATLRLSIDTGADSQTVELTQLSDTTMRYRAIGGNSVKKAHGRKLIKINSEYVLRRK